MITAPKGTCEHGEFLSAITLPGLSLGHATRAVAMAGKDQRNGKTNGLDTGRRKKGEIPAPRTLFSSTLFMIGVGLYCLSLLWPVDSFSPAWVAFPLAIAGIAILLISLRSFWEKAPV